MPSTVSGCGGHRRFAAAGELDHHVLDRCRPAAPDAPCPTPARFIVVPWNNNSGMPLALHRVADRCVTDLERCHGVHRSRRGLDRTEAGDGGRPHQMGPLTECSALRKNPRMCCRRTSSSRTGQRILVEQPAQERCVREVAQQRAVTGEQQLLVGRAGGSCPRPSRAGSTRPRCSNAGRRTPDRSMPRWAPLSSASRRIRRT